MSSSLRPVAAPFVVAAPAGARVRTRLRVPGQDEAVLLRPLPGRLEPPAWQRTPGQIAALAWAVAAMRETLTALPGQRPGPRERVPLISEAVWQITIVDATLVRYQPEIWMTIPAMRLDTSRGGHGNQYPNPPLTRSPHAPRPGN